MESNDKREIINRIRRFNPSARGDFLASFNEEDLLAYLHQLQEVDHENRRKCEPEPVLAH
jgi:hypothetical protein